MTNLTAAETAMATRITRGFGQNVCGFDLLRVNGKSYCIDVNGWSFIKDNNEYYDCCAVRLRALFIDAKRASQSAQPGRTRSPSISNTKASSEQSSPQRHNVMSSAKQTINNSISYLLHRSPSKNLAE